MALIWTGLLGVIALAWLLHGTRSAIGAMQLPWIKNFPPLGDEDCPVVSILFAARDEEEKLPQALAAWKQLDYPRLEVVAVDDRSQDATGRILDEAARNDQRFKVVHVRELPPGWLGKPHGLQKAYENSSGEWLVFTDADVRFAPDLLRRAIALARSRGLDHLTLFSDLEMSGFWETVILTFFATGFHLFVQPARVSNPRSKCYMGSGAFQLVRRSTYEAAGTHKRLAMEVVDDMKLGKLLKRAGFRSAAAVATDALRVRWHDGLGNIVRGVEKNFFAAADYKVSAVAVQVGGLLGLSVLPFLALLFSTGWSQALAAVSVGAALLFQGGVCIVLGVSPLYAFTHPIGAVIFAWMIVRSTMVTLRNGGITWRGTFYPLDQLRRGVV